MIKVVGIGYREWAIKIYEELKKKKINIKIFKKEKIDYKKLDKLRPDYILFYGWSKKVPEQIVKKYKCIMLHPSKLPNFAGGSPLQNQIIRNVKKSAITLFRMSGKIDRGRIINQTPLSLEGSLDEIFFQIVKKGVSQSLKMFSRDTDKIQKIKSLIGVSCFRLKTQPSFLWVVLTWIGEDEVPSLLSTTKS